MSLMLAYCLTHIHCLFFFFFPLKYCWLSLVTKYNVSYELDLSFALDMSFTKYFWLQNTKYTYSLDMSFALDLTHKYTYSLDLSFATQIHTYSLDLSFCIVSHTNNVSYACIVSLSHTHIQIKYTKKVASPSRFRELLSLLSLLRG